VSVKPFFFSHKGGHTTTHSLKGISIPQIQPASFIIQKFGKKRGRRFCGGKKKVRSWKNPPSHPRVAILDYTGGGLYAFL